MTKGKRRERQAAALYERAGYETFRPQESKYGETDIFGLFDGLAVADSGGNHRYFQVKSNRAEGIESWVTDAVQFVSGPQVRAHFLVCYDRAGWRLYEDWGDGMGHWVVDEREMDCAMGDGLVDYLRGDNGEA